MKLATKSPIRNSGQDHETGDTGAPQTPRVLWKVVRTIIPISLLTFVFLTTDWSALVQTAGRAHSTPLIGAFMLYQVAILIQGSRWHVLISADGGNWPWKRVQWTNYTSTFFDGFTPGKLGSDAFRVACFRDTGKIHHLVISLLTLRLHGMAASFFMAAIVGTIVLSIKHGWLKVALPSALAAIAFAVLLGISYRFVRKGTLHVKYNNTGIKQKSRFRFHGRMTP
ncbi:MAG: flippase-like domain-containing protein [Planctomycetes bacterium]|nr:flippase-like domain-containing protein [Planctomycetota bacterium]